MAVTIPNSAGYGNDSVNAPEWAQLIPNAGRQYGVVNEGSWVARYGSADREIRLSAGTGYGCGVIDRTTAEASLILPASSSGSVYHLIYVHRDWNNNRSSFDTKAGTSARQLPVRDTTPGQADDQPIWLARVDAGKSQVQELIDLRVWGGSYASDELVLQYMNFLGTRLRIGSVIWERVLNSLSQPVWVRDSGAAPIGSVIPFAGTVAPAGWLFCDGRAVKQADYPTLFAALGSPWTVGNDPGYFVLPAMGGRVPVGVQASDGDFALGKTGGEKAHRLTVEEMPSHNHDDPQTATLKYAADQRGNGNWDGGGNRLQGGYTTNRGGDQPHNNLQPYLALNYIIRAL